jgi:hypothetical protein
VFIFHSFLFLNDVVSGSYNVASNLQQEKLQQKLFILQKFVTTQNVGVGCSVASPSQSLVATDLRSLVIVN